MTPGTPVALISLALEPATPADAEKLARGLEQLAAEQFELCVRSAADDWRVVIAAADERQLELILDRLKREFGVEASVGRPEVLCREAVTQPAEGEMKHLSDAGGRHEYAHVKIRLHPAAEGSGYTFENLAAAFIPAAFVSAVEAGVREALARGVIAGFPISDARIEVLDGSYHAQDSTDAAFRLAASAAAQQAAQRAAPVLLEPVMALEVTVPGESLDDVLKNIVGRRGEIQARQDRGDSQVVTARVPLAQLFGYAADLRSRTRGRGTYTIRFDTYEPVRADDGDDGRRDALVTAPLKPPRNPKTSSVSLPEPDDDPSG
jgi:elongation factor G